MFHRLTPKQLAVGVLQYEKSFTALPKGRVEPRRGEGCKATEKDKPVGRDHTVNRFRLSIAIFSAVAKVALEEPWLSPKRLTA